MKKVITLVLLALAIATQVQAIRPLPKLWPMNQSDGTTVMVYINGDGHVAFYTTEDGKVLVKNDAGDLCYAMFSNGRLVPSTLIAHNADQRSEAEKTFLLTNNVESRLSELNELVARRAPNKAIIGSTPDGLGKYNKSGMGAVKSLGERKVPVIMVEFSDLKFKSTTTIDKMTRYYNEEGYHDETYCVGSARDFFIAQSRGMFKPTFEIVGIVTLANSYKYYGANDRNGNDKNVDGMVVDAVRAAEAKGVDFSKFKDEDGNVELVSILYAGRGEATEGGQGANYVWPCESDFNKNIGANHFNSYFVGNELYNDGALMGMGIFCHEFGHALGLPDFYCTNYSYRGDDPFSNWSIMDTGPYVNKARAPMGYTAYERSYLGWLDIPELTKAQSVTLTPHDATEGNLAVMFRRPGVTNEYYILENRKPGTWYPETDADGNNYGSGLMLTHIAYNAGSWSGNILNNVRTNKRAHIVTADKQTLQYGGSQTNLYGNGVNEIKYLPLYGGGTLTSMPIFKIKKNADKTITFNFITEDGKHVPYKIGDKITEGGIDYKYVDNREFTVIRKQSGEYSADVNIPNTLTIDDVVYEVVAIADSAFAGYTTLTSVSIPKSIRKIAPNAFRGTSAMTKFSVEEGSQYYQTIDDALFIRSAEYDGSNWQTSKTDVSMFNFNENEWGLPVSETSNPSAGHITSPIEQDDITLTTTDGRSQTKLMKNNGKITLRIYRGGSIILSVPQGSSVTRASFGATQFNMTANTGTIDSKVWTGNSQNVTFNCTSNTVLDSITVTVKSVSKGEPALICYPAAKTGSYTVPKMVTRIASYAFEATKLSNLTLSEALLKLGKNSLSSANLLVINALAATPAKATADPFADIDFTKCKLNVPEASKALYVAADYWNKFFRGTNGISGITDSKSSAPKVYYDLQGRRVSHPKRGIYITKGSKVLVK